MPGLLPKSTLGCNSTNAGASASTRIPPAPTFNVELFPASAVVLPPTCFENRTELTRLEVEPRFTLRLITTSAPSGGAVAATLPLTVQVAAVFQSPLSTAETYVAP